MLDSTICNAFPYDETMLLWATVIGEGGTTYYIVSDTLRQEYYLYKDKKKAVPHDTAVTGMFLREIHPS